MQKIHAIFYGNFPKRRKTFESSPFRWNPQVNKRKTPWRGRGVDTPLAEPSARGYKGGFTRIESCRRRRAAAGPAGRARWGQVEDAGGAARRKGRPGAAHVTARPQPAAPRAAAAASRAAAPGVLRTRRCPPAPPPRLSATEPGPELPPPQPQPRALW